MKTPVFDSGYLGPDTVTELLHICDLTVRRALYTDLRIDGLKDQIGASVLPYLVSGGATTLQVEIDGVGYPRYAAAVNSIARQVTKEKYYRRMGINYYLGPDDREAFQAIHFDSSYAEVLTLEGIGGVALFDRETDVRNATPADAIATLDCEPGDRFTAGSLPHAGFGIGNRTSIYFY